ncbi:MAG TPA: TetR family transcriptional regulator [Gaiellaceae bacterium]|nr:TetR family transcriptional regulator [Gaiellaceae bacterium]
MRSKPGVKRAQILEVAAEQFGRNGYEETKWADVAESVGIGSTALYHYFESKQHCLFEIIAKAVTDFREQFDRRIAEHDDWGEALVAVLRGGFEVSEWEILRLRVLTAEHGRIAVHASLPREEAARATARANKRDLEFAWGAFLARGMEQGLLPERSPQLLARAVIGLYNSVWVWYRPGGSLPLEEVARFYVDRQLDVLGADPKLAARWLEAAA